MALAQIFLIYLKIGALAFGGGYVMLPLIEAEFVAGRNVIAKEDVHALFALAQALPGIVAVNMAVILGHRLRGIAGALVAAVGVMLPAIVIITVIAAGFRRFADVPAVQKVLRGLNIAVVAVIVRALLQMGKSGVKDAVTAVIFLAVFVATVLTDVSPAYFAIGGGLLGLLLAGRGQNDHA